MCNSIFSRTKQILAGLVRRDEGASALEYALMAAMVAVAVVPFVPTIAERIGTIFTAIQNALTTTT